MESPWCQSSRNLASCLSLWLPGSSKETWDLATWDPRFKVHSWWVGPVNTWWKLVVLYNKSRKTKVFNLFHDNLIVNMYKHARFLGKYNLWTQFDERRKRKISPYQLFITTFGGAATPTKTTCFLPLLCTAGTLDTHQLTCIQDCCPGYRSLSKGPGLRGSFRRDTRGGRRGLLATRRPALLRPGSLGGGSLPYLWADSQTPTLRYQGCDWHHASSYTLHVFRDTGRPQQLRRDVPAHIEWEKKPPSTGKCFTFDTRHTHKQDCDRPTFVESHSQDKQEVNWADQNNLVSQYTGL